MDTPLTYKANQTLTRITEQIIKSFDIEGGISEGMCGMERTYELGETEWTNPFQTKYYQ